MFNENVVFKFSKDDIAKRVWEAFLANSGLRKDKPDYAEKVKRLQKTAFKYRELADSRVDVRATVVEADFLIENGNIIIEGKDYGQFSLNNDETQKIKKIYAYILCAGQFETDIDPVTDAFVDLWGNAYCEVGIDILREKLAEEENSWVSSYFGPGFFQIGVDKVGHITKIAQGDSIGVTVTGHHMIPLKSCAGFFITSDEPLNLLKRDCKNCIGNRGNCNYCKNFID